MSQICTPKADNFRYLRYTADTTSMAELLTFTADLGVSFVVSTEAVAIEFASGEFIVLEEEDRLVLMFGDLEVFSEDDFDEHFYG